MNSYIYTFNYYGKDLNTYPFECLFLHFFFDRILLNLADKDKFMQIILLLFKNFKKKLFSFIFYGIIFNIAEFETRNSEWKPAQQNLSCSGCMRS